MTQLLDLPDEIIAIIVKELDTVSQHSMYSSCTRIRSVVVMYGVIKECHMSMNTLATVNSLKLNFFKDISNHLLELNMKGVPDLFKTKVLPAFKKLKNLKTLDISYTDLHILDLLEIHSVCPTIVDVTVNYSFGSSDHIEVSDKTVLQCQLMFAHLENLHLVGSFKNILYSEILSYMFKRSKLNSLKLSITEENKAHQIIVTPAMEDLRNEFPILNQFSMYLVNWGVIKMYRSISEIPFLSVCNFQNYEFCVIGTITKHLVHATPMFTKFFEENFGIIIKCVSQFRGNLQDNMVLMLWNKETTQFDDTFFVKLKRCVKHYFPFRYHSQASCSDLKKYDWFIADPIGKLENHEDENCDTLIKKRRAAIPTLVLNYDDAFKEKDRVQLNISFYQLKYAVSLTANCVYLQKLTYLSIRGPACYSSEFFNTLFRCCDNLLTLNVEAPTISPCSARISRSIPLSRTLKNIRLVDKRIDLKTVFSSFSQCQTLENIHLIDQSQWEHGEIADPSILLQTCTKLYCVFIEASFAASAVHKQSKMFSVAKARFDKHYIKVVINQESNNKSFPYAYNPFVSVFRVNPIKPI